MKERVVETGADGSDSFFPRSGASLRLRISLPLVPVFLFHVSRDCHLHYLAPSTSLSCPVLSKFHISGIVLSYERLVRTQKWSSVVHVNGAFVGPLHTNETTGCWMRTRSDAVTHGLNLLRPSFLSSHRLFPPQDPTVGPSERIAYLAISESPS